MADPSNKVGEAFVEVRYALDGLGSGLRDMRSQISGQVNATTRDAEASFSRMRQSIVSNLRSVAGALGVGLSVRSIQLAADSWSDLSSRVGIAVGNMELAPQVMARIQSIARQTYSSLELTAESFSRNASVIRELGRSSNDALDFTEALNNALVVSGAKGQRAATVQEALSRALAGGALRGQELNTVLESGGRVAEALADGLGVSTLELRNLGAAGALTSDRVISALISQMQRLAEEAESMPATIGDAFQLIQNSFTAYIGTADKAIGVSEGIATALIAVSDNMNVLAGIAAGAASLALIKVASSAGTAVAAFRLLTIAIAANPLGLLAVAVSAAIGALVAFKDETLNILGVTVRVGGVLSAVWTTVSQSIIGVVGWVYNLLQALGRLATFDIAGSLQDVGEAGQALRQSGAEIAESWAAAFREAAGDISGVVEGELDAVKATAANGLVLDDLLGSSADATAAEIRTIGNAIRDVKFDTMLVGLEDAGAEALRAARSLGLIRDVAGDLDSTEPASLFAVQSGAGEDVLRLQRALQDLAAAQKAVADEAAKNEELDARATTVRESIMTATERYNRELARLTELHQAGRLSADEFAKALAKLNAEFSKDDVGTSRLEDLQETLGKVGEQMVGFGQVTQDTLLGFAQGAANYALEAGNAFGNAKALGEKAMKGLEDALVDFAMTGKLAVRDMVQSILADLARLAIRQALSGVLGGLLGAATSALAGGFASGTSGTATAGAGAGAGASGGGTFNLRGFQTGGRFRVGGSGGVDTSLVAFKATPGEVVEVHKGTDDYRNSKGGGGVSESQSIQIDARGADVGAEARIRQAMKDTIEQTKAAVREEAMRSRTYGRAFG